MPARSRAGRPRRLTAPAVAALLAASFALPAALAAPGELGTPLLVNYSPKRHQTAIGPQHWAVAQDRRGVMYFGNAAGVLEYDGVSWRIVRIPNRSVVRSLAVDARGRLWVGANGDFGFLAADPEGYLSFHSLLDRVPEAARGFADVWKIHVAPEGVYFQTFERLFRWRDGRIDSWEPASSFHFSHFAAGALWILERDRGLLRMGAAGLEPVPGGEALAGDRLYALLPLPDGRLLAAARDAGMLVYDGTAFAPYASPAAELLREGQVYHAIVLPDGGLAFGTLRAGVVIVEPDGTLRQRLDRTSGLQDQDVKALYVDREGGLWVALGNQVSRVEIGVPMTVFDERHGLEGEVQAIERRGETLHLATTQGLFVVDRGARRGAPGSSPGRAPEAAASAATVRPVAGVETQSWMLLPVEDGMLAATNDGVFLVRDGGALPAERVAEGRAASLARSRRDPGRVWVGLFDGLASLRRDRGRWIAEGRLAGVADDVRWLAEDAAGELWLATPYDGAVRLTLKPGSREVLRRRVYDRASGWPGDPGRVRVYETSRGLLFTSALGLARFDPRADRFVPDSRYGAPLADGEHWVAAAEEDAEGNLWAISGGEGTVLVSRRRAGGVHALDPRPFPRLPADDMWGLHVDPDGVVWVGHADGLLRLDPTVRERRPGRFVTLLRRVKTPGEVSTLFAGAHRGAAGVAGVEQLGSAPPELAPDRNALRFEFAGVTFGREDATEYQSYLQGFDPGWSGWTRESWRDYTNLPPGSYRFHVRARNLLGETGTQASWRFAVRAPWYRTLPAYLGLAVLFAGALLGSGRLFARRARRRALTEAEHTRRFEELEAARRIQHQLLPVSLPSLPYLDLAAHQVTASEIGGDYYDFFPQADGGLYVAVGDATGHGVAAGLMVAATKTALLTIREPDLRATARELNGILRRVGLERRLNMALVLARLLPESGNGHGPGMVRLLLSGGGMPPVYVVRGSGEVEEVELPALPLGALEGADYPLVEARLAPGDVVFLLSDGLPERFNRQGESFGYERLLIELRHVADTYRRSGHRLRAEELLRRLARAGDGWSGDEPLRDDVTLLVLRVVGGAGAVAERPG
jgi:serine phosphatase RsbU (regulator of sigma subunit)/ligand-binding sensor domain-containing protein